MSADRYIETWTIKGKPRRVYVARSAKGSIESWRYVKDSKLTKEEAIETFKKNRTFDKNTIKTSIPFSKTTIQLNLANRDQSIPKRFQQLAMRVRWTTPTGRTIIETTGYSQLLSKQSEDTAKEQAFAMAKGIAVGTGRIKYDHEYFIIVQQYYQAYLTKYHTTKEQATA